MIYLVGNWHDAYGWGMDNNVEISPRNCDIRLIVGLDAAHGYRPAPDDRIVLLRHGDPEAAARLRDAQEFGAPADDARGLHRGRAALLW